MNNFTANNRQVASTRWESQFDDKGHRSWTFVKKEIYDKTRWKWCRETEDRFADRVNAHAVTHLAVHPLPSLTVEKTRQQSRAHIRQYSDNVSNRISRTRKLFVCLSISCCYVVATSLTINQRDKRAFQQYIHHF